MWNVESTRGGKFGPWYSCLRKKQLRKRRLREEMARTGIRNWPSDSKAHCLVLFCYPPLHWLPWKSNRKEKLEENNGYDSSSLYEAPTTRTALLSPTQALTVGWDPCRGEDRQRWRKDSFTASSLRPQPNPGASSQEAVPDVNPRGALNHHQQLTKMKKNGTCQNLSLGEKRNLW